MTEGLKIVGSVKKTMFKVASISGTARLSLRARAWLFKARLTRFFISVLELFSKVFCLGCFSFFELE